MEGEGEFARLVVPQTEGETLAVRVNDGVPLGERDEEGVWERVVVWDRLPDGVREEDGVVVGERVEVGVLETPSGSGGGSDGHTAAEEGAGDVDAAVGPRVMFHARPKAPVTDVSASTTT